MKLFTKANSSRKSHNIVHVSKLVAVYCSSTTSILNYVDAYKCCSHYIIDLIHAVISEDGNKIVTSYVPLNTCETML